MLLPVHELPIDNDSVHIYGFLTILNTQQTLPRKGLEVFKRKIMWWFAKICFVLK